MDRKSPNKMYEVLQKSKRNNIYTNGRLHNGNQNLEFFSPTRPLSAE